MDRWHIGLMTLGGVLAMALGAVTADDAAAGDRPVPGKFLTISSPVDDAMAGRIRNLALTLQTEASQQNREAVLVLVISPGPNEFHHVQNVAGFLTSGRLTRVRTVAWVPKNVTGNTVVLALACNEIIMHPDAELGDISLGQPIDDHERSFIEDLVEKRHNRQVNRALARGLFNHKARVLMITEQVEGGGTRKQVVTPDELKRLQAEKPMTKIVSEIIKQPGTRGTFSGRVARDLGILVVKTATAKGEIATTYGLARESMNEEPAAGEPPVARLIKITDEINPNLESFVNREIDRAAREGANLLVFEINSPGGDVYSSMSIAQAIANLKKERGIHAVAYIPEKAISGAAMIALGCDEIYMHTDAMIGNIVPIEIQPGGPVERAREKILIMVTGTLRTLADQKGRPPGLAEAMADKDLQVFTVVNRSGRTVYKTDAELAEAEEGAFGKKRPVAETREDTPLLVDGRRAHELTLVEPTVTGLKELKQRLGIPASQELIGVEPSWVDDLVYVLQFREAMFFLFFFGATFIYLELNTMTGVCGILSTVCFSLYFWSRWGGSAGWLEVMLFLLGLALIAMEVFVIPGFGVFGISGGLLVLVSLVLANESGGFPQTGESLKNLGGTTGTLAASLVCVVVSAMLLSRFLPQMPVLKHMLLVPPGSTDVELDPRIAEGGTPTALIEADPELLGTIGEATSLLRPAGKARFGEALVDVVSNGPYIPAGRAVEVIDVTGNRVVVREPPTSG